MTEDTSRTRPAADRPRRGRGDLPRQRARRLPRRRSGRSSARWTSTRRFRARCIDELFDLGVMGDRGSRGLRRRRRPRSSTAVLAVEELSRVDPVGRRPGGRPEHARHQRRCCAGARRHQAPVPPARSPRARWAPTRCRRPAPAATRSRSRRARREDGDGYVLTGRKLWITNGNEADLFIVFATVNPEAGYRGITAFLVERGIAGFTVGKKEDKLGIRASSTCELHLRGLPRAEGHTSSARSARATRRRSRRSTKGASASARR